MKITFNSWDSFCEYLNRTPGIKSFKPIIESRIKLVDNIFDDIFLNYYSEDNNISSFKPKISDDITVEFTYV